MDPIILQKSTVSGYAEHNKQCFKLIVKALMEEVTTFSIKESADITATFVGNKKRGDQVLTVQLSISSDKQLVAVFQKDAHIKRSACNKHPPKEISYSPKQLSDDTGSVIGKIKKVMLSWFDVDDSCPYTVRIDLKIEDSLLNNYTGDICLTAIDEDNAKKVAEVIFTKTKLSDLAYADLRGILRIYLDNTEMMLRKTIHMFEIDPNDNPTVVENFRAQVCKQLDNKIANQLHERKPTKKSTNNPQPWWKRLLQGLAWK